MGYTNKRDGKGTSHKGEEIMCQWLTGKKE